MSVGTVVVVVLPSLTVRRRGTDTVRVLRQNLGQRFHIAQQAEGVVRGETVRGGTGERVGQGTYEDPVDNNGGEGIGDTIGLGLLR